MDRTRDEAAKSVAANRSTGGVPTSRPAREYVNACPVRNGQLQSPSAEVTKAPSPTDRERNVMNNQGDHVNWTSEKPTKPGWYWVRYGGWDRVKYVHCVSNQGTPSVLRVEMPDGWFEDVHNVDGQWSSEPIAPPGE